MALKWSEDCSGRAGHKSRITAIWVIFFLVPIYIGHHGHHTLQADILHDFPLDGRGAGALGHVASVLQGSGDICIQSWSNSESAYAEVIFL